MKILIIGDANSIWVKNYCREVLIKNGYEIEILSKTVNKFREFYTTNNIVLLEYSNIKTLNRTVKTIRQSKIIFDFIHVQYCSRFNLRIALRLKNTSLNGIIATFWGSDILRINTRNAVELALYLSFVNKVVVLTNNMYTAFKSSVILRRFSKNIIIQDFGVSIFDDIFNMYDCRDYCRKQLGIPPEKIVIGIGYNRSEGQQHLKVLQELENNIINNKDKIFISLQMTYGVCSAEYYNRIIELLERSGVAYKVFDKYMLDEEVAWLRLSTDVYINAQVTDALSATINEYLYSGSIVLNPTWLRYKELDDYGIEYVSYNSLCDISSIIQSILDGEIKINCLKNRDILREIYSWNTKRNAWNKLYERDIL